MCLQMTSVEEFTVCVKCLIKIQDNRRPLFKCHLEIQKCQPLHGNYCRPLSYPCVAQCPWAKVSCFVDSLWHAKCQRAGRAVKAQGAPCLGGTEGPSYWPSPLSGMHSPRCYIICFFCLFVFLQRVFSLTIYSQREAGKITGAREGGTTSKDRRPRTQPAHDKHPAPWLFLVGGKPF